MSKDPKAVQASGSLPPDPSKGDSVAAGQLAGMKSGEYLLHVFIEETRGLKHPKSADSTVDPIIEIKGFGHSRFSKVQKEVGSGATFWGEHFFFEKNFETAFHLDSEKITISVSDHNTFGFDSIIGTVEINLSTVYYKPGHVLEYQWAALSGLTKNYQEVLGFIKFSIGIFAAGDEQKPLTTEKILDAHGGPDKSNVLYPPQIVTEPYQIKIRLFRGEKLKKMDTFGKTDAYIHVFYGGLEIKSQVIKSTLDPVWNEELSIPASLPTINDFVTVRVLDWESGVQTNEVMGTSSFNIKDIMDGKYKLPFWMNIYGAPTDAKNPYKTQMNEVPELATEWKGRIQMAITMRPEEKPIVGDGPLKDPAMIKAGENIKRETLELRAEIHYAMNLRKDGEDYTVKIRWGPAEVSTKKRSSKNRMIEIYESLVLPCEFPFSNAEDVEVPDVFIYINNGDKNLSVVRKSWTEFRKIDLKSGNLYFKVDKSVTTTREDLAGIVKMRVFIARPEERQAMSMYGWDKPIQKSQAKNGWKVHCNIFMAQDIVAGDSNGLSDAYLNVYFNGTELSTSVINETVNPIWNERLEYGAYFDIVDDAPPVFLTLWDKDVTSSDFLGSAMYIISQANLNPQQMPKPEWVDFRIGKSGGVFGRVLLSVCCYNRPELIPRSPYIEPETMKYYINMKVLGLRELESVGILPVRRAFVRFDVDSLKGKHEKSHLPEKKFLRTEPLNPGPNPNILTVINLDLQLPSDPEYCPSMGGAVFDYIFKGMSQPLIGNFSIPLGKFIRETSAELEKRIEKLSKIYYATQHIQVDKPAEPRGLIKKLTTDKIPETEETKLDQTSHIEDDYSVSGTAASGKQPLLGKFMGPMVSQFEMIKKEKGFLPGESDDVKIDIYKNSDASKSSAPPDPTDDITEEARASQKFVIVSKYSKEGEELDKPDANKYMELGHNNKAGTYKKHYRYALNTELEQSEYMDKSPFVSIPIYRGKKVPEESMLANIFGKGEDYRCVGYFKTMVTVMSEFDKMKYDAKIQHVGQYATTKGLEFSDDEFLRRRDVLVRLYMIEADGLPDKDSDSNSDPYLIVKLGKTVYNEKQFYQQDNANPLFHKCFEFSTSLPGASKLSIEVWDYDRLDADDLIGTTTIDIEDRWYSSKWRSLKYIPIETRKLYHPSSSLSQGTVKLWLEILPRDLPKPPVWHIAPKPPMEFELRVIVWECKDVPNVDFEDAVDIYITGKLADGQQHRTDTHFRSQNGKGSFNWRMVFPVSLPMKKHRISFQIWDKDLLSANDYISEATFDFDLEAAKAFEKEEIVPILGPSGTDQKFWIPCSNNKMDHGKAVQENLGSILVSMSLVPKKQAELTPVGQGRGNPNQNPYLPPPEGRFEWTWNIIKLYQQLVGPLARRKILIWGGAICCIFIIIMLLPMIIANVITNVV